jgi:DNA-directed RNA polymerase specialized sigma24 family protein
MMLAWRTLLTCGGNILSEAKDLTKLFESHRSHLHAVAYRMLGSASEADDAVQEAWLRLNRSNTSEVANFGAG